MGIEIDDSKFPHVITRWTGELSDAELTAVLLQLDAWLARGGPVALLLDARGATGMNAYQRSLLVNHMKAARHLTERQFIQALVIDSPVIRALYFAVSWAFPMPFPSKVFAEPEPARAWLEAQLRYKLRGEKGEKAPSEVSHDLNA